jgi:hypothetical protein
MKVLFLLLLLLLGEIRIPMKEKKKKGAFYLCSSTQRIMVWPPPLIRFTNGSSPHDLDPDTCGAKLCVATNPSAVRITRMVNIVLICIRNE